MKTPKQKTSKSKGLDIIVVLGVTVSKSGQAIVLDGLLSVAQSSRVEIKLT